MATSIIFGGLAYAQQCNIIYVSPTGASSGIAGTQQNPASLSYGISLASTMNSQVWLANGSYSISNALYLISDITIEGGFDPITWVKSNTPASIINRNNSNILLNPGRLVAMECVGINNFRIQDISINVGNAVGDGVSVYGIHLDSCSNYSITRVIVNSGNGVDGLSGIFGTIGINGTSGQAGQQGDGNGGCCTAGGIGGAGSFPGSFGGGNGGAGGSRGSGNSWCFGSGNSAPDGSVGANGTGLGPGTGGAGGTGYCATACVSFGCDAGPANAGNDGIDGANGNNGLVGNYGAPGFGNYYINGDGQPGAQGEHGSGGGGGGGGGSQGCLWSLFGNYNGAGAGGGGGGEGGQGGTGAFGGTGGGSSFGVYIYNNWAGTEVKDCSLNSGLQGLGGLGGSPGGVGGFGGSGGLGTSSDCDLGDPGDGGGGGIGGIGGDGGNGSPGVSLPLYEDPAGISAAQSDMSSSVEPQIFVKNTGCTFSDIEFYTNASGIINWYFDGGATPLSAVGDSAVIQYTTMGRHTITLVVDGVPYIFTDFVGIFSDGSIYLPSVQSSATVTCPGDNNNFSSSFTSALFYDWTVYDNTSVTYSGSSITSINHTFGDTGTYEVTLQTTSICCGRSKIDTFLVEVAPVLDPNIFVSVTSSNICEGDITTFGAIPINGGADPSYQWLINNSPVGMDTNVFTSGSLNNGDVVTCVMTTNYPCPSTPSVVSAPIAISVNPLPSATCSASRLYLGANTEFEVIPSVGTTPFTYEWDFGDGGIDTGMTALHLYGGTGSYSYTVTITDSNGCVGVCSNVLTIVVAPFVSADFTSTFTQGCDFATVTFTDASIGSPDSWFWDFNDGATSTQQNPTHTFTSAGSYNITLAATNGVYTDTIIYPNYVVVYVSPIAGLTSFETTGCSAISTRFLDQSFGATAWTWDFGDGNVSTLQNPSNVFSNIGSYNVTLTVSNGICVDDSAITIDVYSSPTAAFTRDSACATETIHFTDYSYITNSGTSIIDQWTWDFGDGSSIVYDVNPTYEYPNGGIFVASLVVTTNFGCSDTIVDTVNIFPKPKAQFIMDPDSATILNPVISFTDESIGGGINQWNWSFGDNDSSLIQHPVHEYVDTGTYNILLIVKDTNNCLDIASENLIILPDYIFFIPNTFTPNNDGFNEDFLPRARGVNQLGYSFSIFNRWGDLIWETTNYQVPWDGTANKSKEMVQTDVYVWMIISKDMTGKSHLYTGHISLIR